MKQRTRPMHSGDDLTGFTMGNKKNDGQGDEIKLYRVKPQEHFIEAQVQEDDTLQAIALRFHCSIQELKRINHIHKDNEIYARRTVKVPVTPYSVLTEMIPTSTTPSTSKQVPITPIQNTTNQTDVSVHNNNTKTKENDFSIDCNAVVMNSTLAPAVIPYTDMEMTDPVSEDTKLLPSKDRVPVETVVVKQLTSQGADFGIKWYHLVFCLLALGVVTPLVYVLFYLDKHEHPDVPPLHSV
ncbi:hypothetical protein JYU34_014450 [Plutella xylostella]|uniref:LysM domain-containing protein n=1 Tax=Plutella xylostella TaxID=51655 RepID=A0ABQ7Q8C5_PLUXY|nr:hypothetical protein JYU34_014450 [Plutella xylostella]